LPGQPQARSHRGLTRAACAVLHKRCRGIAHAACAHLPVRCRSPRESYNPEAENFSRERGSYQNEMEHP
jgi:hypothetical protein